MLNPFNKIRELEKRIEELEEQCHLYKAGDYCTRCKNLIPPDKFNGGRATARCKFDKSIKCIGFEE